MIVKLTKLHEPKNHRPLKLAIKMSGSGSNATKIIERYLQQLEEGRVSFEPVVIFTDNPDSNAQKIAREMFASRGFSPGFHVNSIKDFYKKNGSDNLRDMDIRAKYDEETAHILSGYGVDAIALAGYDWVTMPVICDNFLTVNVHPGNLSVKFPEGHKKAGKPMYIGLGWVPSAKAVLHGEYSVNTSVHLVTPELDAGSLLALSYPQDIPEEVTSLEDRSVLLGEADSIGGILKFIRENPHTSNEELSKRFPIYGIAKDLQARLLTTGDHVIFSQTIENISKGHYQRNSNGDLYFKNQAIPDGVLFGPDKKPMVGSEL